MVEKFLNFTRFKQIIYVTIFELMILGAVNLFALRDGLLSIKVVSLLYRPIFSLPSHLNSFLLVPCDGAGCAFPDLTLLGTIYAIILSVSMVIIVAFGICLLVEMLARRAKIG